MESFSDKLSDLIEFYSRMENTDFTIMIRKSVDPTKRPGGGWKNAISIQVAMKLAEKEVLIIVGPMTSAYYYK